ncbi:mannitol dehydrogenase [Novosphingobium endophyticum]|uniref:Mannitol dehydrogenase n=1 Tax=Novosphingobium endophyticum TaxID=1955250 RepID=A0A916TPH0_9SPHN|nr:mannitol dehydrogenase family protein [Novosphingobium endophyticum]GGB87266.1 mannitol dehydrogenase [Novosphingobium endophyticum]
MRLSSANAARLSAAVSRFDYDRDAQRVGIVHFGIGAFHRAHQAWYTDRAMDAGDRDWSILGVSLRSAGVAEQLNPQDGLYTVTERSGAGAATRLVGAVREVLVAPSSRASLAASLIAPSTRIVSFTVTEKGYCRAPDGSLDIALADAGSFYPILADAMRERRASGIGGLTLMSCDNLSENGRQLQRLMAEYLAAREPGLLDWFEAECSCPSTMVDRIVPATTGEDRDTLADTIGLVDEAAVFTEPFSQWVIEDSFAAGRPGWEAVGAQLVADVAPYETAKLRMLNGAHSALAYIGLERGHEFVHQAVADPAIRPVVEQLMRGEAAPTIAAGPGQDLGAYAGSLLERFANPALNHRLEQIAMDGSQKIPQRWLETLAARSSAGQASPSVMIALAAWLRHVRGDARRVDDPLAPKLAEAWRQHGAEGIVGCLFAPGGIMAGKWQPSEGDKSVLTASLTGMR